MNKSTPSSTIQEIEKVGCHCGKDGHALNSINCPIHGFESEMVPYAFPLRKDKVVGLYLPDDITLQEAERISMYIKSLVNSNDR